MTTEEIQAAFGMLDVDKNGRISLPNLKKRLGSLFPGNFDLKLYLRIVVYAICEITRHDREGI